MTIERYELTDKSINVPLKTRRSLKHVTVTTRSYEGVEVLANRMTVLRLLVPTMDGGKAEATFHTGVSFNSTDDLVLRPVRAIGSPRPIDVELDFVE